MNQLTKKSSESEIKAYFIQVLNLARSKEEFPVDLDDVWPLAYAAKTKAVQTLRSSDYFVEGFDYQVLNQEGKDVSDVSYQKVRNPKGGRPIKKIMLSVPCLEYLIA